jgi:5-methylcytosine-specific restriction endonuclease McrA
VAVEEPYWRNPRRGAMRRAAHWLATEVGEGRKFRKADLRNAIQDREQVDRRMRDLRGKHGWVIHNYRDRTDLSPDEHLLVAIGDRVWQETYRPPRGDAISASVRRRVFDRDGNRCVVCGIAAGEEYPTLPGIRARLTLGHITPRGRKGWNNPDNFRTECAICNEPSRHLTTTPVDPELLKARIRELPRADKRRLAEWIRNERRDFREVERLWIQWRQLPARQRDTVRDLLEELTAGQDC